MKFFTKKEYEKFAKKLERLTLKQLEQIAEKTGLIFTDTEERKLTKEDYLLTLDESYKDELIDAYNEVTKLN